MSERDAIPQAAVVKAAQAISPKYWEAALEDARAALEAALPHLHPTVATAEELDALPVGSVVLMDDGSIWFKRTQRPKSVMWERIGHSQWGQSNVVVRHGHATVLHRGQP